MTIYFIKHFLNKFDSQCETPVIRWKVSEMKTKILNNDITALSFRPNPCLVSLLTSNVIIPRHIIGANSKQKKQPIYRYK